MKFNKTELTLMGILFVFLMSAFLFFVYKWENLQPTFDVIEAQRTTDYQYGVVLRDKKGFSFYLEMDLVKFSAIGVNVNDILSYGEL